MLYCRRHRTLCCRYRWCHQFKFSPSLLLASQRWCVSSLLWLFHLAASTVVTDFCQVNFALLRRFFLAITATARSSACHQILLLSFCCHQVLSLFPSCCCHWSAATGKSTWIWLGFGSTSRVSLCCCFSASSIIAMLLLYICRHSPVAFSMTLLPAVAASVTKWSLYHSRCSPVRVCF